VVSTPVKNISQREGLSHILWKIKKMFQTTNQLLLWLLVVEKTLNESVIIPKKTMIEGATFDRAVESLGC